MRYRLYLSAACAGLCLAIIQAETASAQNALAPGTASPGVPATATGDLAQPGGAGITFGDIVVTAQKRSERLQDVPVSITAASANELKSRGVTSTDDLGKLAPGFTATKSSFGIPIYFIRGVGFVDESIGISPAVMTYVDQIPFDFAPMGRGAILDLQRVEILKGPQGTLFGENTTGGAINYIAAKPTDHLAAGVEGTYSRFNDAEGEGYISGPLANNLTARLAVQGEQSDGWQKGYPGDEGYSATARLGAKRFINGRLLVDWNPSEATKVEFMASGWQDHSDTQAPQLLGVTLNKTAAEGGYVNPYPVSTVPPPPHDNQYAGFDVGGDFRQHNSLYEFALHIDQKLSDEFTLTSLASYALYKRYSPVDADGTIYPSDTVTVVGDVTTFNEELRVSGKVNQAIKLTVGGNYSYDKVLEAENFDSHYSSNILGPYAYQTFGLDNNQWINTYSGFASSDIRLANTVSAQLGLRYTAQDRNFAGCSRDLGDGGIAQGFAWLSELLTGQSSVMIPPGSCITLNAATFLPTLSNIQSSLNQHNLSWRANLSWEPTRALHLYANITKGYKSGSFPTLPAATAAQLIPVKQESVLAYEVGAKASLLDHHVQIAAAAFYYDYRNKQLVGYADIVPFGPLTALVNIPKSKIEGAEFNIDARPIDGLTFSLGGTYLKTAVLTDPQVPTGPFGNIGSFVGDQFPFTSNWQGMADVQYKTHVSNNLLGYIGASITAKTKAPSSLYTNASSVYALEQGLNLPGYKTVDARIGFQPPGQNWNIELFARNIFNEYYAQSAGKYVDYRFLYTGMPPTYGVRVRFDFD